MLKYFPGLFGATGIVVYMAPLFMYNSPSWSVWMVPGCEDGL